VNASPGGTNAHRGPSRKGKLGTFDEGSPVYVIQTGHNGWVLVRGSLNGQTQTAWVQGADLKDNPKVFTVKNSKGTVFYSTLSAAQAKKEKPDVFPIGTSLTEIGESKNGWTYVKGSIGGRTYRGWIQTKNLLQPQPGAGAAAARSTPTATPTVLPRGVRTQK
jgi:hypothetical protein